MAKKPTKKPVSRAVRNTGRKVEATAKQAQYWYMKSIKDIKKLNANDLMKSNNHRLLPSTRVGRIHIGRIILFFYDPKTKDKLPYWDTFPCVIPINLYRDGFLGINLHYLPRGLRKRLLDSLLDVYGDKYMDERRKLQISYAMLNASKRHWMFRPCIKRYLKTYVRSRFFLVNPEDWKLVAMLPTERFIGANKSKVWTDSRKKLGLA